MLVGSYEVKICKGVLNLPDELAMEISTEYCYITKSHDENCVYVITFDNEQTEESTKTEILNGNTIILDSTVIDDGEYVLAGVMNRIDVIKKTQWEEDMTDNKELYDILKEFQL